MSSQSSIRTPEPVTVTVTRRALPGREVEMAEGRPTAWRPDVRVGRRRGRAQR